MASKLYHYLMIIFLSILAVSLEETNVKTMWKADQEPRQAVTSIVPSKVSSHNGKTCHKEGSAGI